MTINTAMLVGLGFLIATLIAVIIAPAYRRRTVRLTSEALKRSLPMTDAEIRADKDRLRAEHAIRIHTLESKLEKATLSSARQKIEVNRRDARISELEGMASQQRTQLDELDNARRVLEQTVTDRLPKIENRLIDARRLLTQRDNEIATLADTAQRQARAIGEAAQINIQQSSEIERLTSALATRGARNHNSLGDSRFDGEIALRSEIDALRARSREQSALISSLQDLVSRPVVAPVPLASARTVDPLLENVENRAAVDAEAARREIARLKSALADAEMALATARAKGDGDRSFSDAASAETDRKLKDSPIAVKAKISELEAQIRDQAVTIQTLRAETAAVNERLARQAAQHVDEMKRLGAGTLPASGESRRARPEPAKRSLSERISDPRVVHLTPLAEKRHGGDSGDSDTGERTVAPLFSMADQAAASTAVEALAEEPVAAAQPAPAVRRPRLLERITSIDKPGST